MHLHRLLSVLLVLAGWPFMAQAGLMDFADGCPKDTPPADIRVSLEMYDPPVYNTYSIPELSRMHNNTSPYASDAVVHTYGITKNPLVFSVGSQIASAMNIMTRKKCYWYKSISLTLRVKPEIYMGKEIPKGGCYFNAVLKHELEHANIERRLLQDYQPIITNTLTDFVRQTGLIRNIDEGRDPEIYDHLKKALERQIDTIHLHMDPVRKARQAEIDTAASYEATAAPCRGVEQAPY